MKIIDHRLCQDDGTPYPFVESPNVGGKLKHEYLVMHYTSGSSAEGAVKWLTNPMAQASAHLVIGRDASITQLVPFDTVAWHAGPSVWEGRVGLNQYSIGIELDNAGVLTRHGDRWRAWFGVEYEPHEVIEAVHKHETVARGWQIYTPHQIEAALGAAIALIDTYGIHDVIGHDDIAPGRKTDPGPAFPMQSFSACLLGRRASEPAQYETIAVLNIRTGPGAEHAMLEGSPLPLGTRLEIVDRDRLWALVDVLDTVNGVMDMEGWVRTRYIRRVVPEPD